MSFPTSGSRLGSRWQCPRVSSYHGRASTIWPCVSMPSAVWTPLVSSAVRGGVIVG